MDAVVEGNFIGRAKYHSMVLFKFSKSETHSPELPRVLTYPSKLICNSCHYKAYKHEPEGIYIPFVLIQSLYQSVSDMSNSKSQISQIVELAIVEHQNSTIEEIKIPSTIPSTESPIHTSSPNSPIPKVKPDNPSNIPTSSNNEFFDITTALDHLYKKREIRF